MWCDVMYILYYIYIHKYTHACISIIHIWRIFSNIKRPFPWMATMAGGGQLWHGLCVPGTVRESWWKPRWDLFDQSYGSQRSRWFFPCPEYSHDIPMIFPLNPDFLMLNPGFSTTSQRTIEMDPASYPTGSSRRWRLPCHWPPCWIRRSPAWPWGPWVVWAPWRRSSVPWLWKSWGCGKHWENKGGRIENGHL